MRTDDREARYWEHHVVPMTRYVEDAISAVIRLHLDGLQRCGICDEEGHSAEQCGVW